MAPHLGSQNGPLDVESQAARSKAVQQMFSAIAPRYDLLNHLLSLNVDRAWRRRAVRALNWNDRPEGRYLDICAGTFDLSLELARQPGFRGEIVAADFSHAMLRQGLRKIRDYPVAALGADALELPIDGERFDGAMVAFGIRNLTDIDRGILELHRVLRPESRLVILDFSTPARQPFRWLYLSYFTRLLPCIGRLVSKHSHAYSYLPESVVGFDSPEQMARRLENAGFVDTGWNLLTGGIACIWNARKGSDR